MFFSVEFGIGKEVEPRFYNAECAIGTLLRTLRDDAVAVIGNQIEAKMAEYKADIPKIEQELVELQTQPGGAAKGPAKPPAKVDERKSELQRIKTNISKLEELKPFIGKINKVDLSYSDAPTGRLNLDFDSYSPANISVQPKTRTWLVGIVDAEGPGTVLKWDL